MPDVTDDTTQDVPESIPHCPREQPHIEASLLYPIAPLLWTLCVLIRQDTMFGKPRNTRGHFRSGDVRSEPISNFVISVYPHCDATCNGVQPVFMSC